MRGKERNEGMMENRYGIRNEERVRASSPGLRASIPGMNRGVG